jgi:hypothetical protein
MNHIPYQITSDGTLTVVIEGTAHIIHSDNEAFDLVVSVINDDTLTYEAAIESIKRALAPASLIADAIDDDRVTIENNRVLFDGENVPSSLTRKLLSVVRSGLPIGPWKRFVVRVFANPSRGAQAELNEFLELANLPITEDGCFLAYKRVRDDYRDLHSGTFDNSVGKVVEMPRADVDNNRDRTCSTGLHFCSQDYLRHFYPGGGRIVIVKVNPTDVVSIPSDYKFTKGRTCRYEVVGEVDLSAESTKEDWGVYDDSFNPDDWNWDDWDEDESDWEEDGVDAIDDDGVLWGFRPDDTQVAAEADTKKSRLKLLQEKFMNRRNSPT